MSWIVGPIQPGIVSWTTSTGMVGLPTTLPLSRSLFRLRSWEKLWQNNLIGFNLFTGPERRIHPFHRQSRMSQLDVTRGFENLWWARGLWWRQFFSGSNDRFWWIRPYDLWRSGCCGCRYNRLLGDLNGRFDTGTNFFYIRANFVNTLTNLFDPKLIER